MAEKTEMLGWGFWVDGWDKKNYLEMRLFFIFILIIFKNLKELKFRGGEEI